MSSFEPPVVVGRESVIDDLSEAREHRTTMRRNETMKRKRKTERERRIERQRVHREAADEFCALLRAVVAVVNQRIDS